MGMRDHETLSKNLPKMQTSASTGKVMTYPFRDAYGITFIDYRVKQKIMNSEYYMVLLKRLKAETYHVQQSFNYVNRTDNSECQHRNSFNSEDRPSGNPVDINMAMIDPTYDRTIANYDHLVKTHCSLQFDSQNFKRYHYHL